MYFKFVLIAVVYANFITAYDGVEVVDLLQIGPEENSHRLNLWITISARTRFLEISWKNAPARDGDMILLTKQAPYSFEKVRLVTGTPLAQFGTTEGSGAAGDVAFVPISSSTSSGRLYETRRESFYENTEIDGSGEGAGFMNIAALESSTSSPLPHVYWISNNGMNDIVAAIQPSLSSQWFTTGVPFDFALSRNVTANTGCYGYWASYINMEGTIMAKSCLRAYPRWMQEMRSVVGGLRMRDLFIPGTHDSGSYRPSFDPLLHETLVTKYALTQDDDIRGQLMHGARYLDIRVGYYRNTPDLFFVNHGITRQRPLSEVIEQVKNFVAETNEIIIFGLKEFPVGFGKKLDVHRLLIHYLREQFGELVVHPSATWQATLQDIWTRRQNIILAYDKSAMVYEYPELLFNSVDQRWGNVRNWTRLERHLRNTNSYDVSRLSSRPVADMAELTPDTWGVILDKYGGLRKMADNVNWRISQLYRDELGATANIVAVDFIRGTSIMETAIDWNRRKVIS